MSDIATVIETMQKKPLRRDAPPAKTLVYVTPYLPPQGVQAAKSHKIATKRPVFIKAFLHDPTMSNYCKNCGGGRRVVMNLIEKGPYRDVPTTQNAITWFDGDGENGKGWYVIERTLSFDCPECVK